jgi:DNA-binding NtrC family response regulator
LNQTILVVDDDQSVCKLTTLMLNESGFQVLEARCGERGVQCFMEHADEIQMVLTDVMMPEMTGPEMVERILAARPQVKVLFMTGYDSSSLLPDHFVRKFGVLGKPFTAGRLVRAVRDCLDR